MPLIKDDYAGNISELIRSGHDPVQAANIAIAHGDDRAAGILHRVGDSVLLVLRAPTAGDFPLHWGLVGGHIDDGETSEQAAIRESTEEIGRTPSEPLRLLDWSDGFTTYGIDLPEIFAPALNDEHIGYMWAPLSALPQPLHPGVALTLSRLPVAPGGVGMDARLVDGNGWFEVRDNPLSKVGIFPYSGRQLGLDTDEVFQVLRPEEELSDPACVESFKLLPWIDEHVMLGPVAQEMSPSAVPAEKKGVAGVVGENVYFKDGVLRGNIKAFSSTLATLIAAGKRELSAGYRCIYDMTAGTWNGKPYDAVQRKIRGNHLALVTEGRMGPDVAVMDHFTFTFDAQEAYMADETTEGGGSPDLAAAVATISQLVPELSKLVAALSPLLGAAEKTEAAASGMTEDKPKEPTDMEPVEDKAKPAMDAAEMERHLVGVIARRDQLARQISQHVGTFDHSDKTLGEVVAYGCDKLGIKAEKGQELSTLSGYLQAKPVTTPSATVHTGLDSANPTGASFVDRHLNPKKEG
jgi:hypothetical protein